MSFFSFQKETQSPHAFLSFTSRRLESYAPPFRVLDTNSIVISFTFRGYPISIYFVPSHLFTKDGNRGGSVKARFAVSKPLLFQQTESGIIQGPFLCVCGVRCHCQVVSKFCYAGSWRMLFKLSSLPQESRGKLPK